MNPDLAGQGDAVLSVRDLSFAYGANRVLDGVSFDVSPGELLGLVGPNGAGKTTLLKLVLGFLAPSAGEARLFGQSASRTDRRVMARRIAYVAQETARTFTFPVRDFVEMGRLPHLGRFSPMAPADHRAVERALSQTGASAWSGRPVTELSGGEWQRVLLARAFAQETPVLALDEPTLHLDLAAQFELMDLLRSRARRGAAVLASIHDLNLAARYVDKALVLSGGRPRAFGRPSEVLTPACLAEVFRVGGRVEAGPEGPRLEILGPLSSDPPAR